MDSNRVSPARDFPGANYTCLEESTYLSMQSAFNEINLLGALTSSIEKCKFPLC